MKAINAESEGEGHETVGGWGNLPFPRLHATHAYMQFPSVISLDRAKGDFLGIMRFHQPRKFIYCLRRAIPGQKIPSYREFQTEIASWRELYPPRVTHVEKNKGGKITTPDRAFHARTRPRFARYFRTISGFDRSLDRS